MRHLTALSTNLGIDLKKVEKSFILHSIGRMAIYSPEVEKVYRTHKNKNLRSKTNKVGKRTIDQDAKVNTQELNVKVENITDLLALRRLIRRSQLRKYNDFDTNNYQYSTISAKIKFYLKKQKNRLKVEENLVTSTKGLGKVGFLVLT